MSVVFGIDAAWTPGAPSGLALVVSEGSSWRCVAAAPSYEAFLALAHGTRVDWRQRRFAGSVPDVPALLAAAHGLADAPVDVVAIDMPISKLPIDGRRAADDGISRAFGARGCSAHSPGVARPGALGAALSRAFTAAGFLLATTTTNSSATGPHLLEVYPHPALLSLLRRDYRVPYKVARARRYWPSQSRQGRIQALLTEFEAIYDALNVTFPRPPVPRPSAIKAETLNALKRYEDVLDALVCAWVGVQFLAGNATAYGDETAAVWCPAS